MESVLFIVLIVAGLAISRVWSLPKLVELLHQEMTRRKASQALLEAELRELREQLAELKQQVNPRPAAPGVPLSRPAEAYPTSTTAGASAPPESPTPAAPTIAPPTVWTPPTFVPEPEPVAPEPEPEPEPAAPEAVEQRPEPAAPGTSEPQVFAFEPITSELIAPEPLPETAAPELIAAEPPVPEPVAAEPSEATPVEPEPVTTEPAASAHTDVEPAVEEPTFDEPVVPAPVADEDVMDEPAIAEPAAADASAPEAFEPASFELEPELEPVLEATAAPVAPPAVPPPPPRRPVPPAPTEPTWWDRASTIVLENWTGILGAVVLVTGVGFLGIYATLRLAPPFRFLMICAFAVGLLGARFALRNRAFARQLNGWLLSSAAAIFLFACVGSVSIAGLRWATPPFDYLLLLAGVSANLGLAWRASREEISSLHGVLSLVALAVLPPTGLTLAAAAGVTTFSIAITYRQRWKYQLLLSIVSFFAFHLYWHQAQAAVAGSPRVVAMTLVGLVGVAAAVVQYRSVYARRRFEPLLFTAHLLNWTCLGINLYLYSTGSIWKTIPLALGSLLTFWAGRRARQLGIGWLFQTDTIIALMLALATALSLQGWHATNSVILLFMLLESLLVALIMARQSEALVYRVALSGAYLAGAGLLLLAGSKLGRSVPAVLYRDAFVLGLAGWAALAFVRFIFRQPLLAAPAETTEAARHTPTTHQHLLNGFAGLGGLLQAGAGLLLARVVFGWADAPVGLLIGALLGLGGAALGLAAWLRRSWQTPEWIRQQQLLLAQSFTVLAGFGLHELGLSWPVVLGLLFAENLLVTMRTARQREALLYRVALGGAYLFGSSLVLTVIGKLNGPPAELYRNALVLALAGWAGVAFVRLTHRQLTASIIQVGANENRRAAWQLGVPDLAWLTSFAGLGGLLQAGAGLLLAWVVFGWADAPVGLLIGALLGLGGAALGLAAWLGASKLLPEWVRQQQLVLSQFFGLLALLSLHETGLRWPVVTALLYAENLVVAWLTARRHERLLYRIALAGAYATGAALLLLTGSRAGRDLPAVLYRNALMLALAGWAGVLFAPLAYRQLVRSRPDTIDGQAEINANDRELLSGLAGLAGALQAGAGALVARVLFGWHPAAGGPLVALLALAGAALGLAAWLRARGTLPGWVRRQQLVLGQFCVVLAVVGLHELGLSWPGVFFVLYAENLAAAVLLQGRDEPVFLHLQTYVLVVLAALLPLLVRYVAPDTLGILPRAALLTGAALLTVAYQLRRGLRRQSASELAVFQLSSALRIPALGLGAGWLLLSAGALAYERPWAGWAMVALLGGLLYLRTRVAAPGLWAGLVLAAVGYLALQWHYVLLPGATLSSGQVLRYLLPTLAVPVVGLLASWWAAGGRFVRGPWLYLLALHLVVALVAAVPGGHLAYLVLGLLGLAGAAFVAALVWRRALPDAAAVRRAGSPDRFLLHGGYALLSAGLAAHLGLLHQPETFFGQPAEYFTAALVFSLMASMAATPPPASAPVYKSWRLLHPWLPEAALLFGTATLWHNIRTPWLALVWVSAALALRYLAARVPLRLRRLGAYGRPYYWLAAGTACVAGLLCLSPGQLLSPAWWEIAAAVGLLFGYAWLALAPAQLPETGLPPAWEALARPPRRVLEATLLYPAFLALAVLLIQSFDRSVLTVLLMLEVVAVFSTSLLLRRQDLRYLALAGMLACLVRLVFFDLSQSGTVTRAVVFILMGLLLLGMNALYARFKGRFINE